MLEITEVSDESIERFIRNLKVAGFCENCSEKIDLSVYDTAGFLTYIPLVKVWVTAHTCQVKEGDPLVTPERRIITEMAAKDPASVYEIESAIRALLSDINRRQDITRSMDKLFDIVIQNAKIAFCRNTIIDCEVETVQIVDRC